MISDDQFRLPHADRARDPQGVLGPATADDAWFGSLSTYPRDATVVDLFENAAKLHPDSVAIVAGTIRLTYSELDLQANRLAHRLRRAGIDSETLVGVCLERSEQLIVALLAILKAGGAYVPLDPKDPLERLNAIVIDTQIDVLLTVKGVSHHLPRISRAINPDSGSDAQPFVAADDEPPVRSTTATSLAYVMYTSGSTGKPKGVMVENRAIVRLVSSTNYCEFDTGGVFLQAAPVTFDASTFEIWGALLSGGTLVLAPQTSSLEDLGRLIREEHVNTLWLTASLFNLFVDERLSDLAPIKQLLTGGEALSATHVRRALAGLPNTTLINGYGPTEGTTFTCFHQMRRGDVIPDSVPLGRPIANTRVYILDEAQQLVPPGATGELYAGGDGVARGYLNAEALTAEKFVRDPFSNLPHARMYRTGDLARWRQDGVIEFLGRIDHQVKILGHRIEPGEIEAILGQHADVMQTCVVTHLDQAGNKHLIAYIVARPGSEPADQTLKSFLAVHLPAYMVPEYFVQVSSFPMTPNGKLDRTALPPPDWHGKALLGEAPHSEVELKISAIWQEVLGFDRLTSDDNFFDIGGTSLLLLAVHSRIQKALTINLAVVDLFEFTTIRQLAEHVANSAKDAPLLASAQSQGQRQREAFARRRVMKGLMQ